MRDTAIIVLAKAPWPGLSKTRLCPPCTQDEAALIAHAGLLDTLDAVAAVDTARRVLVCDGTPPAHPADLECLPQRGRGLGERIAGAFEDVGAPALLIGMDTPQVTAALLEHALRTLGRPRVGAVLGDTPDGGYWSVGLRRGNRHAFVGVPMSTARTSSAQRRRLQDLGLEVADLPRLRDVDFFDDAEDVAGAIPGSRFARAVTMTMQKSA
ncbi:MAG: DUF2064 domain-containing protein [Actinomycetota bacterium]